MGDDLRRLREREESRRDPEALPGVLGSPAMLAVSAAQSTTAPGRFFAANPAIITGPEVEGGEAIITRDRSTTIYVLERGAAVPPAGTLITVSGRPHRWVRDTCDGETAADPTPGGGTAGCCPGRTPPASMFITTKYGTLTLPFDKFLAMNGIVAFPGTPTDPFANQTCWGKAFDVIEPTAAVYAHCPRDPIFGQVADRVVATGSTVRVTYAVQCIPSRVYYAPLGRELEPGSFLVLKTCAVVTITDCLTSASHPPPTIEHHMTAISPAGQATYFGNPASDPCAISLSATLVIMGNSGPAYDVVAMPETVTVSE